jgi:hypothetical protein
MPRLLTSMNWMRDKRLALGSMKIYKNLCGQFAPSDFPAIFYYVSSGSRGHPRAKTVFTSPFYLFWLKGVFHCHMRFIIT